jgi:pimeloyl-ACP methyl ester carboxylesterase
MDANSWSDFMTQAATNFSLASTNSTLDFSNQGTISKTQVEMLDLSNHDASSIFHLCTPTFDFPSTESCEEHLATQLKVLVEHITADGSMVFLVGHSLGGLSVRYYSEGAADLGVEPDSKVFGALSIATPHDIEDPDYEEKLGSVEMVVHLLRLIGAVDHDYALNPASVPLAGASGPNNIDHISTEAMRQLASFLMNTNRSQGFEEVVI